MCTLTTPQSRPLTPAAAARTRAPGPCRRGAAARRQTCGTDNAGAAAQCLDVIVQDNWGCLAHNERAVRLWKEASPNLLQSAPLTAWAVMGWLQTPAAPWPAPAAGGAPWRAPGRCSLSERGWAAGELGQPEAPNLVRHQSVGSGLRPGIRHMRADKQQEVHVASIRTIPKVRQHCAAPARHPPAMSRASTRAPASHTRRMMAACPLPVGRSVTKLTRWAPAGVCARGDGATSAMRMWVHGGIEERCLLTLTTLEAAASTLEGPYRTQ